MTLPYCSSKQLGLPMLFFCDKAGVEAQHTYMMLYLLAYHVTAQFGSAYGP